MYQECEQRAVDMTDGNAADLGEAIDQWENERQALADLFDENQALTLSFRRYHITMSLAEAVIRLLEAEAGMFITQTARNKIKEFHEQLGKLRKFIAQDMSIVADAHTRRNQRKGA
jgi:hypothetical protein